MRTIGQVLRADAACERLADHETLQIAVDCGVEGVGLNGTPARKVREALSRLGLRIDAVDAAIRAGRELIDVSASIADGEDAVRAAETAHTKAKRRIGTGDCGGTSQAQLDAHAKALTVLRHRRASVATLKGRIPQLRSDAKLGE